MSSGDNEASQHGRCIPAISGCTFPACHRNLTPPHVAAVDGHSQRKILDEKTNRVAETEKLMAQALNRLSTKEREHVTNDLHGVVDFPEETNEFIQEKLNQMQLELDRNVLPNRHFNITAYLLARSKSNEYVTDPSFLLRFLRAEFYNPLEAAKRMIYFLEDKLELFGIEYLTKPTIQLEDLPKEDLAYYQTGFFQLLPHRDQIGRAIVVGTASLAAKVPWESRRRVVWCIYNAKDEDVQQKGVIVVVNGIGSDSLFGPNNKPNSQIWTPSSPNLGISFLLQQ